MRRLFSLVILILLLVPSRSSFAMVVAKRDFADLVARAEQIVIATVLRVREDDDTNGLRRTVVVVGELTVLKGSVSGSQIDLDFAGGKSGSDNSRILDMPTFREGERAVLFIAGNGTAVCPLVGVWQGRFRVEIDAQSGAEIVTADDGRRITGLAKRNLRFAARQATEPGVTLDRFREMIAEELARPSTTP